VFARFTIGELVQIVAKEKQQKERQHLHHSNAMELLKKERGARKKQPTQVVVVIYINP
jgi:hypothetical protein